jgi:23S rRNA (cytidine1920-2'-O)/16S rRNA (cytidine1409-2'-O)-methyltransferase
MSDAPSSPAPQYVSRAGLKLHHALAEFQLDPTGRVCADFGCNVGGFTDCLLRHHAAHVYAIDTGYGALAWTLRNDPRITVMERTNALHAPPPAPPPPRPTRNVIDMGWAPQRPCIPAALKWLDPAAESPHAPRIITLIKPHYELIPAERSLLRKGVLNPEDSERIAQRTLESLPELGVRILAHTLSPLRGGAGKGHAHGNTEYLALLAPIA